MDVLSCLYPSYIFSFIMGFAPFKIDRKGALVEFKCLNIYCIVSTLFYAVFICLVIGINIYRKDYFLVQTPMQRFITFLYVLLVVGFLSINVILNKIHSTSLIKLWKKMYHIDMLIKSMAIKLNYKKMMYTILVNSIVGVTLQASYIFYLICIQSYKNLLFSLNVYFALNLAISGFICVSCSFHAFFLIIGNMFEKILGHLEDSLLKSPRLSIHWKSKIILETARLHQDLCEVARLANEVTSVQMLASFAVTFALITLQIYSVITAFNINKVDYKLVISSLMSVVILIAEKFNIGMVSHRCMEMMPKTKKLLSKLLNVYTNEFKIYREINAFNLQIIHDQFVITAGSFFVIDSPIFLTAGSAITTYIIIFFQADPFIDLYQNMKDMVGAI